MKTVWMSAVDTLNIFGSLFTLKTCVSLWKANSMHLCMNRSPPSLEVYTGGALEKAYTPFATHSATADGT